jgi:hypothetical protein
MVLRLSKMLVKQNVDFQHYLFSQTETGILQQISNCMRCHKLGVCDAYLDAQHTGGMDDYRFCPNHAVIRRLKKLPTPGNRRATRQ